VPSILLNEAMFPPFGKTIPGRRMTGGCEAVDASRYAQPVSQPCRIGIGAPVVAIPFDPAIGTTFLGRVTRIGNPR
jgi:hypothetical protein